MSTNSREIILNTERTTSENLRDFIYENNITGYGFDWCSLDLII